MEAGFVLMHRSLLGHPAFRDDGEAMAFMWMVARASWRPARLRYKGRSVEVRRGELCVSVRDMAASLGRDKAWIERLWTRLKRETMIETRSETAATVVTICNYDKYQNHARHGETPNETPAETPNETAVRQRRDTEQEREQGNKGSTTTDSPSTPRENRNPPLNENLRAVMEAAGMIAPPSDARLLGEWLALPTCTMHQDIIPIVERVASEVRARTGRVPFKLTLFDEAIRAKIADDVAYFEASRRRRADMAKLEADTIAENERQARLDAEDRAHRARAANGTIQ
jgi:hypothetical protein